MDMSFLRNAIPAMTFQRKTAQPAPRCSFILLGTFLFLGRAARAVHNGESNAPCALGRIRLSCRVHSVHLLLAVRETHPTVTATPPRM